MTVIIFILVLSLLVFVHELGHFIFAKRAGILVREFAIGFGPKVFAKVKGETLYSIRALPLGGFVRMAGEDEEALDLKEDLYVYAKQNEAGDIQDIYLYRPMQVTQKYLTGKIIKADIDQNLFVTLENEQGLEITYSIDKEAHIHYNPKQTLQISPRDRQFNSKTVGQKSAVIFAGPFFNVLLTVVLLIIYVGLTGVVQSISILNVFPNTPAAEVGLRAEDKIVAINGDNVSSAERFRYYISSSDGKPFELTVKRSEGLFTYTIAPEKMQDGYRIGVSPYNEVREASFGEAIKAGFTETYNYFAIILDGLGKLVTGQVSINQLAGPVQMGEITGKAAEHGIASLIKWTALLSLNLGIVNMLPIPALDGSRLVFVGLEALRGKPISSNKEGVVHLVGFALLMMLMIVVTFNDIKKVFNI